jgi:hypothetical protein
VFSGKIASYLYLAMNATSCMNSVGPQLLLQVSDLIQVLLRPVPERRPSAEQLLTCSKLDNEVSTSVVDPDLDPGGPK